MPTVRRCAESPLVLGNRFSDDWFSGQMRDVQVWDLALSEAQVEEWLFSENKTSEEYYTAAQSNFCQRWRCPK